MTKVLLIHGINNQDNSAENIKDEWSKALKRGAADSGLTIPDDTKFIAAFYGDVLFQETESWSNNKPASSPMSAESPDEDYADDKVAELYREFQHKYNISDEQVSKVLDENDRAGHVRQANGIHKKWLKAIAGTGLLAGSSYNASDAT